MFVSEICVELKNTQRQVGGPLTKIATIINCLIKL